MEKIYNQESLNQLKDAAKAVIDNTKCRILICSGTGCLAGGSAKIYERMQELVAENQDVEIEFGPEIAHGSDAAVKKSGCPGFCQWGPLVRIEPMGVLYTKVKVEDCDEIFEKTIKHGEIIERLLYNQDGKEYVKTEEIPSYKKQTRVVLENCGKIDPENIEEAIACDGYQALAKALFTMTPQEVIDEIMEANLRGRGGGGFQTKVHLKNHRKTH